MLIDRYPLRQRLRRLGDITKGGHERHKRLSRLEEEIERSVERVKQRRDGRPKVEYDDELPICARRAEIAEAIRHNQVVIVCGETGSGKSTQLPKICLELGRGVTGMIGHTQPRRIAARSVAARVAEELGTTLGEDVGFKIRFTDSTSPGTYIKLMTDGILLAETQNDRRLNQYDTLIIDEAHERSLNIDFLLGYVKQLLARRGDLKLIITSATIDATRFARHFGNKQGPAPVVEVSGRTYPVELRHRPLLAGDDDVDDVDWLTGLTDAVDELARIDRGDMLIFLPTERDIHEATKVLRSRDIPGDGGTRSTEILPLYARLPMSQQQKIFNPGKRRRIVLATNVAESSLTVPGIRYVIDTGTARIARYSARSRTQRLPIEPIAQASADQRMGRCGRIGPGVCIRLYGEADYESRDRYTAPEIQRSNLASVILQAVSLGLGELDDFPLLDPPKPAAIRDGYKTLYELGAIDEERQLTDLGWRLSKLPVDPRIGRMILAADEENCLSEMLIIASALEIRDPRDRPAEKQGEADQAHARHAHEESDFLVYLNLWDFYHGLKQKLSRSQLRKACVQNFLSANRMREWIDIHRQLLQIVAQAGLKLHRRRDSAGKRGQAPRGQGSSEDESRLARSQSPFSADLYDAVHRAVLTGLLSSIGLRSTKFEYTASGGTKFALWPGSALFQKKPKWVVAAELVETGRRYLRTCARIDPRWIEPLAEHVVKRTYADPHWDARSDMAMVFEKVSLFGLIIVPRRRTRLEPIDPPTARQLFIADGLVKGAVKLKAPFLRHNQELVAEMERLGRKLRRTDFVLGEWSQVDFYDARIPHDVCDTAALNRWRNDAERENRHLLFMTPHDVVREEERLAEGEGYPDAITTGSVQLPVDYQFKPGSDDDGVNVLVPIEQVDRVDARRLGWLVPGLLEAKVVALIKSLPKPLRRNLVPAPDTARRVVDQLQFGQGALLQSVATLLSQLGGARITVADFDESRVPDELKMNVQVRDADGKLVAHGRELHDVQHQLREVTSKTIEQIDEGPWHRDAVTRWDFDRLPEQVDVRRDGLTLKAYPMLVDQGDSVALRVSDTLDEAEYVSRHGLTRLFFLTCRRELRAQVAWFPDVEPMRLHAATIAEFDLREELAVLLAHLSMHVTGERTNEANDVLPRTLEEFQCRVDEAKGRIGLTVQEAAGVMPSLLERYHKARLAVENGRSSRWTYAIDDMQEQIGRLMGPRFLIRTPWPWLQQYPRYFRAIEARVDALRSGHQRRDEQATQEMRSHWEAYDVMVRQHADLGIHDPELELLRWMLEEYRVSLLAQKLGTSVPVSAKRIAKQWEKVRQ